MDYAYGNYRNSRDRYNSSNYRSSYAPRDEPRDEPRDYHDQHHDGYANSGRYETSGRPQRNGLYPSVNGAYDERRERSSRRRSYSRARYTYPPPPSCEDEASAVSKEWPPRRLSVSDVESRGTIEQDPIMIELINPERRFVLQADPVPLTKSQIEQNEARKRAMRERRRQKSNRFSDTSESEKETLKVDTNTERFFDRRKPTPYSFTKEQEETYEDRRKPTPYSFTKEPTKDASKDSAREPKRKSTRESLRQSTRESREPKRESTRESIREPTREYREAKREPTRESTRESTRDSQRDPPRKATSGDTYLSPDVMENRRTTSRHRSGSNASSLRREDSRRSGSNAAGRSDYSEESDVDPSDASRRRRDHGSRSARTSGSGVPRASAIRQASYGGTSSPKSPSLRKELSSASMKGAALGAGAGAAAALGLGLLDDRTETPKASLLNPKPSSRSASTHSRKREDGPEPAYGSSSRSERPRHIAIPETESSSPRAGYESDHSSKGRSPRGSRPQSPRSPYEPYPAEPPRDKYDRPPQVSIPIRQSKAPAPSKLSSSIVQSPESMTPRSGPYFSNGRHSSAAPYPEDMNGSGSGSLLYPMDDGFLSMPSVAAYQLNSEPGPSVPKPNATGSGSSGASKSSGVPKPFSDRISSLPADDAKRSSPRIGSGVSRTPSVSEDESRYQRRTQRHSSGSSGPKTLPPCPRRQFSNHYDDWYNLEGSSNFDVCPHCYNDILKPSPFYQAFVRSPTRPPTISTRCDFGSPWTRIAWLLTVKHKLKNLDLIYALADAWAREPPCPEYEKIPGPWWGLVDKDLYFIQEFFICPRDKASVEALFPSLTGAFTKVPSSVRSLQACALRTTARRFAVYMDLFDHIHDKSVESFIRANSNTSSWDLRIRRSLTGSADTRPLLDLARSLSTKPECPRSRGVLEGPWHVMSDIPDLTICPECYETTVKPAIKRTDLAVGTLFTRAPQNIASSGPVALTCQLYSKRMQTVWDRAVAEDDVEYLLRKMRERRVAEIQIKKDQDEVSRLIRRGDADGYYGGASERNGLIMQLARLDKEWEEME